MDLLLDIPLHKCYGKTVWGHLMQHTLKGTLQAIIIIIIICLPKLPLSFTLLALSVKYALAACCWQNVMQLYALHMGGRELKASMYMRLLLVSGQLWDCCWCLDSCGTVAVVWTAV